MKIKNMIINILIFACLVTFCYSGYQIISLQVELRKIEKEQQAIEEIIDETASESTVVEARFSSKTYDELQKANGDYIGYIEFEKQLISLPIVQTRNNDYYLKHSFYKKYNDRGNPFVDYRNRLSDTNIVMYGHYVYADSTKMFTPLTKLKNQDFYEENKYLNFFLRNEVRSYVVTYVYEHDYTKTEYDYTIRNFSSEDALLDFLAYPKQHSVIQSNIDIAYGDSFITFQTCVRNSRNKRLVVVAKQIASYPLS